jgi:hypothetical protein
LNLKSIDNLITESLRIYLMMEVRGKMQVVCKIQDEYIVDTACASINRLIDDGVIPESALITWRDSSTENNKMH